MALVLDAIVIGGGHNGLVTAGLLAKAGRRVLVLERREVLGGAAATEAVWPGYKVDTGATDAHMLRAAVVEALDLPRHGLAFVDSSGVVLAPRPAGRALTLWREAARTQIELARFSARDAKAYPEFLALGARLIKTLDSISLMTPPNFAGMPPGDLVNWMRVALEVRRMGRHDMMELIRVLPMAAAEWLDEHFESEALKGVLAATAVRGGPWGPRASGTAFMLLYQLLGPAGGQRFVRGGMGQLAKALVAAAIAHGAEVRTGAEVARIVLEDYGGDGRAAGVALAGGEVLRARVIVSNADPQRTLFGLVGAANLEPRYLRAIRNVRMRGGVGRINLALVGLPKFAGVDDAQALSGHIVICPSLDYAERAADDAKYGRPSAQPVLDLVIPTLFDSTLAPEGRHILTVTAQWAPYHLHEGDWDAERERWADRVVALLGEYAPGLADLVVHRQVITPLDYERTYGLTEGSPYHGEMGLDQLLFMRPVAGQGRYRTPIAGLYLCGAGTHPGGGVTGAPGYNAAREVLADLRQRD